MDDFDDFKKENDTDEVEMESEVKIITPLEELKMLAEQDGKVLSEPIGALSRWEIIREVKLQDLYIEKNKHSANKASINNDTIRLEADKKEILEERKVAKDQFHEHLRELKTSHPEMKNLGIEGVENAREFLEKNKTPIYKHETPIYNNKAPTFIDLNPLISETVPTITSAASDPADIKTAIKNKILPAIKTYLPLAVEWFAGYELLETNNPGKNHEVQTFNLLVSGGIALAVFTMTKNLKLLKKKPILWSVLIPSILIIAFFSALARMGGRTFVFSSVDTPYLWLKLLVTPAIFAIMISYSLFEALSKDLKEESEKAKEEALRAERELKLKVLEEKKNFDQEARIVEYNLKLKKFEEKEQALDDASWADYQLKLKEEQARLEEYKIKLKEVEEKKAYCESIITMHRPCEILEEKKKKIITNISFSKGFFKTSENKESAVDVQIRNLDSKTISTILLTEYLKGTFNSATLKDYSAERILEARKKVENLLKDIKDSGGFNFKNNSNDTLELLQ